MSDMISENWHRVQSFTQVEGSNVQTFGTPPTLSKRKMTDRLGGAPLEKRHMSACLSTEPTPSTSSEIDLPHDTHVEEQTGKTENGVNWDVSPLSRTTETISDSDQTGSSGANNPVQEANEQQLAEPDLQASGEEQCFDVSEVVNRKCQHPSRTSCLPIIGKFEGQMQTSMLKGYCRRRDTVEPDQTIKLTEHREYSRGFEYEEYEPVGLGCDSEKVVRVFDRKTKKEHVKKVIKNKRFNDYEAIAQHQLSDTGFCPKLYMVKITKSNVELHMELIEGRPVKSIFEQRIPVLNDSDADLLMSFAFFLLAGGLQAVLEMAKKGFVHRDISANNMIIKKPSTDIHISVSLLDFGLADKFSVEELQSDVHNLVGLYDDLRKMMKEKATQFPDINRSYQIKTLKELEDFYIHVKEIKEKVFRQELMMPLNKRLFPDDYRPVPPTQRQISEGSCSEPSDDEVCRLRKDIDKLMSEVMFRPSDNQPGLTGSTFTPKNKSFEELRAELRCQNLKPEGHEEGLVKDDKADGNSSGNMTATQALSKSDLEDASFSAAEFSTIHLSRSVDEVASDSGSEWPDVDVSLTDVSGVEAKDIDIVKSQQVEK